MTTYFFESITAAQALAFNSASDVLIFGNATSTGNKMSVSYVVTPATPLTVATTSITLTDLADGKSVTFGTGIQGLGEGGHNPIFPDGSVLVVDDNVAGNTAAGSAFGDGMFGGDGNDVL